MKAWHVPCEAEEPAQQPLHRQWGRCEESCALDKGLSPALSSFSGLWDMETGLVSLGSPVHSVKSAQLSWAEIWGCAPSLVRCSAPGGCWNRGGCLCRSSGFSRKSNVSSQPVTRTWLGGVIDSSAFQRGFLKRGGRLSR